MSYGDTGPTYPVIEAYPVPQQPQAALSLEELEATVQQNIQAKQVISRLIREHMQEGIHYTRTLEGRSLDRPLLLDAGLSALLSALHLRPRHHVESVTRELAPIVDAAGNVIGHGRLIHYVIRAELVTKGGEQVVAEGLGSASSFEPRYLYRWVEKEALPPGTDAGKLRSRRRRTREGEVVEYRTINPDLDGLDDTLIKQAAKRAEMDAARQLPGVQEALVIGEVEAPPAAAAAAKEPAPAGSRQPRQATQRHNEGEQAAQRRLIEIARERDPKTSWYVTIARLLELPGAERGYQAIRDEWLAKGRSWQDALAAVEASREQPQRERR